MKFVADQWVDSQIVGRLRAEGHHVAYVAEFRPGAGGGAVLETTNRTDVLLVTATRTWAIWCFASAE